MNVQFAIAGALALVAAAIHGGLGEAVVVTKLRTETLLPTRFGGPTMTKLMIRVTWHVATLAFLVIGAALEVCAPSGSPTACTGVGPVAAISFASYALLAMGLAIAANGPKAVRTMRRHPGPLIFVAIAVLAWSGSA